MKTLSAKTSSASAALLPLGARDLHVWLGDREAVSCTDTFRREVLSRYAAVEPAGWRFVCAASGKPALVDAPRPLAFNCTDSGRWLACAVTAGTAVGIDLEYCSSQRNVLKLAQRFFRPGEIAELQACSDAERVQRFYDYWTLKEARIKAKGVTLGGELETTGFQLGYPAEDKRERGTLCITEDAADAANLAHYCLLDVAPDYRLATCWLRPADFPPRLRLFELRGDGAIAIPPPIRGLSAPVAPAT